MAMLNTCASGSTADGTVCARGTRKAAAQPGDDHSGSAESFTWALTRFLCRVPTTRASSRRLPIARRSTRTQFIPNTSKSRSLAEASASTLSRWTSSAENRDIRAQKDSSSRSSLLLLLVQIPFAYRRYKLRKLSAAIQQTQFATRTPFQRPTTPSTKAWSTCTRFSADTAQVRFPEIIDAAKANQLDFVIMTEHTEKDFDTAAMTFKGSSHDVLFVNGNETSSRERRSSAEAARERFARCLSGRV